MTELIRPALYQAVHHIDALTSDRPPVKYDVVGPICETSDTFRNGMMLPELKRGDLVAIRSAGAYGEVMSSSFKDRKSTRLNSSHVAISYAVFCLKTKIR